MDLTESIARLARQYRPRLGRAVKRLPRRAVFQRDRHRGLGHVADAPRGPQARRDFGRASGNRRAPGFRRFGASVGQFGQQLRDLFRGELELGHIVSPGF